MYTRASASDYDDWEAKYHNPGWGSKEVLPLLKKVRTITWSERTEWCSFHFSQRRSKLYLISLLMVIRARLKSLMAELPPTSVMISSKLLVLTTKRGHSSTTPMGCILAMLMGYVESITVRFIIDRWLTCFSSIALAKVCTIHLFQFTTPEVNPKITTDRWINGENGRRSDAAHNFLYPHITNPNLEILTGCLVKRVIFQYVVLCPYYYVNIYSPASETKRL